MAIEARFTGIRLKGRLVYPKDSNQTLPFSLKRDKEGRISLALHTMARHDGGLLRVLEADKRTASLPSVRFMHVAGGRRHFLQALGLKGTGYIDTGFTPKNAAIKGDTRDDWGVMGRTTADYSRKMAEFLLSKGVRTEVPLFIIRLDEIPSERHLAIPVLQPISGLKSRQSLKEDATPVVYGRGLGVPYRIPHVTSSTREEKQRMLEETFKYLNAEAKFDGNARKPFSANAMGRYYHWFASTLGESLARLHKNGLYHGYLYAAAGHVNVSLDCRLLDLDTVESLPKEGKKTNFKTAQGWKEHDLKTGETLVKLLVNALNADFASRAVRRMPGTQWLEHRGRQENYYGQVLRNSYAREYKRTAEARVQKQPV